MNNSESQRNGKSSKVEKHTNPHVIAAVIISILVLAAFLIPAIILDGIWWIFISAGFSCVVAVTAGIIVGYIQNRPPGNNE